MKSLGIIIIVLTASLIVFVECQSNQRCSNTQDCESGCCFQGNCSADKSLCRIRGFKRKEDKCSSSTDCYTSNRGSCCVRGSCSTCTQNFHDYGGSSSHSGGGTSVGIVIGVVVLLIVKITIWISWCSRRRRRRVVVVRQQAACVAVPIVQNDELEREHDDTKLGIPDSPPPAYSPTPEPHENFTQNTGQTLHQEEGIVNTSYEGVPPPAYDLNPASNPSENANSVQTGQTGTIEHVNPPPYSVATNLHLAQSSPSTPINP